MSVLNKKCKIISSVGIAFMLLIGCQIESMVAYASDTSLPISANVYDLDKDSKYIIEGVSPSKSAAIGTLSIDGDVRTSMNGNPFATYEVKDGNASFTYKISSDVLERAEEEWHIVEDKSNKVNGLTLDENILTGALAGSESFKWGAITGVIAGGATKSVELYRSAHTIPTWQESESEVFKRTKNSKRQVSFLDGEEVPMSTAGATRPDVVVKNADGTIRAIEVKNYNLSETSNCSVMLKTLEREVADRVKNLPAGSTQEIVLDVRGRGFSQELIDFTINAIHSRLDSIYPNIPVTIMRY